MSFALSDEAKMVLAEETQKAIAWWSNLTLQNMSATEWIDSRKVSSAQECCTASDVAGIERADASGRVSIKAHRLAGFSWDVCRNLPSWVSNNAPHGITAVEPIDHRLGRFKGA